MIEIMKDLTYSVNMPRLFIVIMMLCVFPFTAFAKSSGLDESLIYYVYFGSGSDVSRTLRMGADPNARDKHGWPALAIASDRKSTESTPIAKALIKAGADLNLGHKHNYPLINAIKNEDDELVFLMLERNVNLLIQDEKGQNPFLLASVSKNPKISYYFSKIQHEAQQTQTFLTSKTHLRQQLETFTYNNCAFQYWSFYLRSGQDPKLNEFIMKGRIRNHANEAQKGGRELLNNFKMFDQQMIQNLANNTRLKLFSQLDELVSNRNRRKVGVGKKADMERRCSHIVKEVKQQFGVK